MDNKTSKRFEMNKKQFLIYLSFMILPYIVIISAPVFGELNNNPVQSTSLDNIRADLESSNAELRKGAALILGKLQKPEAREMLLSLLEDPVVEVRRAALFSIKEQIHLLNYGAYKYLLSKLNDPDHEIRRMISGSIQKIITYLYRFNLGRPFNLDPSTTEIIINHLQDADPIVRENLLKNRNILRINIPEPVYLDLLEDSETQIIRLALYDLRKYPWSKRLEHIIFNLAKDQEKESLHMDIIQRLIYVPSDKFIRKVIEVFVQSGNPDIKRKALLFRFKRYPECRTVDGQNIVQLILETNNILADHVKRELYQIRSTGLQALTIYQSLSSHPDDEIRLTIWKLLFSYKEMINDMEYIINALKDGDHDVRDYAAEMIDKLNIVIPVEYLKSLSLSSHDDIRLFVLQQIKKIKEVGWDDIVFDLLIDDDLHVRKNAIDVVIQKKIDGWEQIMKQTLLDENIQISYYAMELLLNKRSEGLAILEEFVEENADATIIGVIKTKLNLCIGNSK
ncbi:MAG: HEAT repeat domain-containing protein [Candidatus Anammoxibacter sp.]